MKQSLNVDQSITAADTDESAVRLSALFDDELNDGEALQDLLAHKSDWNLYALIGESLTQSPTTAAIQAPSAGFSRRLAAALEREPAHRGDPQTRVQPPTPDLNPKRRTKWFAWPGLAMAAAIATVVWVAQPLFIEEQAIPLATVSPANADRGVAVSDYTNAHRHFSGPLAVRQASFEPEARE